MRPYAGGRPVPAPTRSDLDRFGRRYTDGARLVRRRRPRPASVAGPPARTPGPRWPSRWPRPSRSGRPPVPDRRERSHRAGSRSPRPRRCCTPTCRSPERVRRISDPGFQVEIWNWTTKDIDALVATGATFSSMTGYIRGTLTDQDGIDELLRTAVESLAGRRASRLPAAQPARHRAGRRRTAGRARRGRHAGDVARRGAHPDPDRRAGRAAGRVFTLENLNTAVDHPGTPFASAADTLALVEAVDAPSANEPGPVPRADRRGEPHRAGRAGAAPGSARSRSPTCRAGASRAPGRSATRPSPRRSPARVHRRRRARGVGVRRSGARPRCVPGGLHPRVSARSRRWIDLLPTA